MTYLQVGLLGFVIGLICGVLLREGVRLIVGADDIDDLHNYKSSATSWVEKWWRPIVIGAVLFTLAFNTWGAVQLNKAIEEDAASKTCQVETTEAAIELWQALEDVLFPQQDPPPTEETRRENLHQAMESYINRLTALNVARLNNTECE